MKKASESGSALELEMSGEMALLSGVLRGNTASLQTQSDTGTTPAIEIWQYGQATLLIYESSESNVSPVPQENVTIKQRTGKSYFTKYIQ